MSESSVVDIIVDGGLSEVESPVIISSAKTAVDFRGRSVADRAKIRLSAQSVARLKFFIFLS